MAINTTANTSRLDFLKYDRTVGLAAMQGRGYYYPVDVAIRDDGRLYVLSRSHDGDTSGVRVTICDLDHEYYGVFGSVGEGDGEFIWATAIALDRAGRVYVADEYTQRITVFDSSGDYLFKWGTPGSGPGELNRPSGMAFDGNEDLWLVDHLNNRVQKFTKDGRFLLSFGVEGAADGQFNLPWGITVAPNGELYVADWRNDRIQKFTPDGRFLAKFGESGDGNGQFYRPSGVAVDGEGYVYVADWGNERVQVLDSEGGFVTKLRGEATLSKWGEEFLRSSADEGAARSESDLEPDVSAVARDAHEESSHIEKYFWGPVSVRLDKDGRLYVVDRNRHRLQVYERGSSGRGSPVT